MTQQVVTPAMIEKRLYDLSKAVDEAHSETVEIESHYNSIKSQYEISLAKSRIKFASVSSPAGKNYTVQEREDMALIENEELHYRMGAAEAQVKATRANAQRLRTQVDIARSIGTSVRTSMDLA